MLSKFANKGLNQAIRSFSAPAAAAPAASIPQFVSTMRTTNASKMDNGVRVASEASHGEVATINVSINSGNRYETAKDSGATQLLEQLAFKGTKSRSHAQLEKEIASIGGRVTARNGREQTVLSATVFKSDVSKAVEILADILQNPTLDEASIKAARDAVLRKSSHNLHNIEAATFDELHSTAFQGTGLGRYLIGADENIGNLTGADLRNFIDTHYTADRVVVTATGNVEHKMLEDLSNKHFGGLKGANGAVSKAEPVMFTGSDKRFRYDSMKTAHIAIAFQTVGATSEYFFPLKLMETIIGSWSRISGPGKHAGTSLAIDVNDHDLVHSFKAFNCNYKEAGLFGVYFTASDNKLDDAMWYTLANLVRMCHDVSEEEVMYAKAQLTANWFANSSSAEAIGSEILAFGRRMPYSEVAARINALTVEDIKNAAGKFINDEDHALAAIGPIYELPDYNWIRRRSYWHRY